MVPGWARPKSSPAAESPPPHAVTETAVSAVASPPGVNPEAEAFGALVALGYKPAEATRLLKAAGPGTHSTEELIRRALQGAI